MLEMLLISIGKFFSKHPEQAMSTYTTHKTPHVTNMPTLTGGVGSAELKRFYSDFFTNPPSIKTTLISRTIGADRVVDEIHLRFKHTEEVPWMLPGVPPTNKKIEIMMVSVVTLRCGRLYHEHVYWDQASVLLQAGLLDLELLSQAAKDLGVKKLPVVGKRAARKVIKNRNESDDEGEADNELIEGWGQAEGNGEQIAAATAKEAS